ncbi:MAG: hypothetical protein OXT71_04630, partial [Acidobacteriota bacterium]|nr:hypothetical protein [Acidobacteriota bacterium]
MTREKRDKSGHRPDAEALLFLPPSIPEGIPFQKGTVCFRECPSTSKKGTVCFFPEKGTVCFFPVSFAVSNSESLLSSGAQNV